MSNTKSIGVSFERTNPVPLDNKSVFNADTHSEALEEATSYVTSDEASVDTSTSYVGQIITTNGYINTVVKSDEALHGRSLYPGIKAQYIDSDNINVANKIALVSEGNKGKISADEIELRNEKVKLYTETTTIDGTTTTKGIIKADELIVDKMISNKTTSLNTTSDIITLRDGAEEGLDDGKYAGIIVNKGFVNEPEGITNNVALVFDNKANAYVGTHDGSVYDLDQLFKTPILNDGSIPMWNTGFQTFMTSPISVSGTPGNLTVSLSAPVQSLQVNDTVAAAYGVFGTRGLYSSGGLQVVAGNTSVQDLEANSGTFSGSVGAVGLSSSSGLRVTSGSTSVQSLNVADGSKFKIGTGNATNNYSLHLKGNSIEALTGAAGNAGKLYTYSNIEAQHGDILAPGRGYTDDTANKAGTTQGRIIAGFDTTSAIDGLPAMITGEIRGRKLSTTGDIVNPNITLSSEGVVTAKSISVSGNIDAQTGNVYAKEGWFSGSIVLNSKTVLTEETLIKIKEVVNYDLASVRYS